MRSAVTKNVWEDFARRNAEYYILTERRDYGDPEARALFFDSGRRDFELVLGAATAWLHGRGAAVEIGCGVGRLTIPAAREFSRVVAVDVSPTMLSKLRENCRAAGVTNVETFLAAEPWDEHAAADLVFSRLVFQHIEELEEIRRYVERIARCLRPDGAAYLQFDTRRRTLGYAVRNRLPDRLLLRQWRRGIRRIRRSRETLIDLFSASRLAVVDELGRGTEDHVFIVKQQDS